MNVVRAGSNAGLVACLLALAMAGCGEGEVSNGAGTSDRIEGLVGLIDLFKTGAALPESKSMTLSATKPYGATGSELTLSVYDADNLDEGQLFVNSCAAIPLFPSPLGADLATVTVVLNISPACWLSGSNTLRFVHSKTDGYRILSATVAFTGGVLVDLFKTGATLPEERSITLSVSKPVSPTGATLTLSVFDADNLNVEGSLYINGNGPLALFPGPLGADSATVSVVFPTNPNWWVSGSNTLRFVHATTDGFRINSATVTFSGSSTATGSATLAWGAPTSGGAAAGYKVHYGTASRSYTTHVDVKNVLTYTVPSLPKGNYYFAITAYNNMGESGYSNEGSKTIP